MTDILDIVNYKATSVYREFLETIEKIQTGRFQDLDPWDEANLESMEDMFVNIIKIREAELISNE